MKYLAPVKHDFLTTQEGEVVFPFGYPTEATTPLRRVLDAAAHPGAAHLLIDFLTGTINQHMAPIRGFYRYLRERTDSDANPADDVPGERTSDRQGKTTYLPSGETQRLLDSLCRDLTGLRDRASVATTVYTFTRVSAALSLRLKDYFPQGGNMHLRIVGKRGVQRLIPAHLALNTYLATYIEAAGLTEKETPIFQSGQWRPAAEEGQPRAVVLTGTPLDHTNALRMIKARPEASGIDSVDCCNTFSAVGVTARLESYGAAEKAAHYAGHSSTRTTQIYERRPEFGSANDIATSRL